MQSFNHHHTSDLNVETTLRSERLSLCAEQREEISLVEILNLDGPIDTEHLAANRDNVIVVWLVVLLVAILLHKWAIVQNWLSENGACGVGKKASGSEFSFMAKGCDQTAFGGKKLILKFELLWLCATRR